MSPRKNKLIMLVDDNDIDIYFNIKLLQLGNITTEDKILSFLTCMDALEYLKRNEKNTDKIPEVMLLDIQMPEMDGFEFLEHYSGLPESLKQTCHIFMLSATEDYTELERAHANPDVKGVLRKPLDTDILKTMLLKE